MTEKKGFALHAFYTRIFKRYDLVNSLFTLGQDQKWRRATANDCLAQSPKKVLDLCCGTGDLAIMVDQLSQDDISITGYDFNENMLALARKKSTGRNIQFLQGDAAQMPFNDESFDSITIGFGFRNLTFNNAARDKHIEEMHRVLKKGGSLFILESSVPQNIFIRIFYKLYLYLFLIPLGGILSGDLKAYWYLAHSSSGFYSVQEIEKMMLDQGFIKFTYKSFLFGATKLMQIIK